MVQYSIVPMSLTTYLVTLPNPRALLALGSGTQVAGGHVSNDHPPRTTHPASRRQQGAGGPGLVRVDPRRQAAERGK